MINTYKEVKNNPKELANFAREISDSLDNITVPIIIKLNTNADDFLFKSKYFMFLSQNKYEEELLRLNNQPTRVNGTIINQYFKSVFGILRVVKLYQRNLKKQN